MRPLTRRARVISIMNSMSFNAEERDEFAKKLIIEYKQASEWLKGNPNEDDVIRLVIVARGLFSR